MVIWLGQRDTERLGWTYYDQCILLLIVLALCQQEEERRISQRAKLGLLFNASVNRISHKLRASQSIRTASN